MPANLSVQVQTLFAPWDDTAGAMLDFVNATERSLFVVIYGFHLPKLSDALLAKHAAGVVIGLILDHSQAAGVAEAKEVQRLVDSGVPLLIGTSPVHGQILHSKFSVRDESAVEFGSWNYSLSATQQSNTMSFITDPNYAAAFLAHYHRLHAAILLTQMAMQPAGAVMAPDIPAEVQATAVAAPVVRKRVKAKAGEHAPTP